MKEYIIVTLNQKLLEIEKEIVNEVGRGEKYYLKILQIEKHKSVKACFSSANWFVLCDLHIFSAKRPSFSQSALHRESMNRDKRSNFLLQFHRSSSHQINESNQYKKRLEIEKRECAWGCARGINTTWENLQFEIKGRHSFHRPDWFVIFAGGIYPPSATSRTMSIVFGIIGSAEALPILCVRCARWERERYRERVRRKWSHVSSAELGDEFCTFPCQNAEIGDEFCTFPCQKSNFRQHQPSSHRKNESN